MKTYIVRVYRACPEDAGRYPALFKMTNLVR